MAKKTFSEAVNEWWVKFSAMKPGTAYEIAKCSKNTELFVDVCKDFIDHSENGNKYELSNDYRYFKRIV